MKTINERIQAIIDDLGMNYSSFGDSIKSSGQVIRSICNGRNKPSYDVIRGVIEKYPQYDALWFTIGIGEMYRANSEKNKELVMVLERERKVLVSDIEELKKDKERLWSLLESTGKKDNPTPEGTNVIKVDFLQKDEQLIA